MTEHQQWAGFECRLPWWGCRWRAWWDGYLQICVVLYWGCLGAVIGYCAFFALFLAVVVGFTLQPGRCTRPEPVARTVRMRRT